MLIIGAGILAWLGLSNTGRLVLIGIMYMLSFCLPLILFIIILMGK